MCKGFVFDTLVDEDNLCNLTRERNLIYESIIKKRNVVIYAPRNYGKTSLVKNVIIKDFKARNKNAYVFYIDLFSVKSIESFNMLLKVALEHSIRDLYIAKIKKEMKDFILSLKPTISYDSITGMANFSFNSIDTDNPSNIFTIFETIQQFSKKYPTLLVIDEFQEILNIEPQIGILRGILQEASFPTIIMGSKQHMLKEIFSNPTKPFYQWGTHISFDPIPYDEYHEYMMERFSNNKLTISIENSKYIQDILHRIPESINIICSEITDSYFDCKITQEVIKNTIMKHIEYKHSKYESIINNYNLNEEKVIIAVSKHRYVKQPNSKDFLKYIGMNHKTVSVIIKRLLDHGTFELTQDGYRLNDPLLEIYVTNNR
ncbi:ATP-binding protein [Candidatus Margulisiibacteriota bacterium]